MPPICKPDSPINLIIFKISSVSSSEIINAVVRYPKIFFWLAELAADAAAVNLNGIKTLLANCVGTFFINAKPAVINCIRKLRNFPSRLTFL